MSIVFSYSTWVKNIKSDKNVSWHCSVHLSAEDQTDRFVGFPNKLMVPFISIFGFKTFMTTLCTAIALHFIAVIP